MTEPDFSKIETAGCPAGDAGRDMILRMNREHGPLRAWGFTHITVGRSVLDVGCGGGAALNELAERFPEARLTGCDVSPLAIETATALNEAHVMSGRMTFHLCGVPDLPFADGAFDTVFSVESLYFWPDALAGLKYGGTSNETFDLPLETPVETYLLRAVSEEYPSLYYSVKFLIYGQPVEAYTDETVSSGRYVIYDTYAKTCWWATEELQIMIEGTD